MTERRDDAGATPTPAEEELLAAALTGDVADDDPRLAALSPAARARLASLRRLQGRLDAAAEQERTTLTEASETPRRVADPVARRFWLRAAGIAALAAGVLLVAQTLKLDGDDPGSGSHGSLGVRHPVTLLAPKGEVADFAEFRWEPREAEPLTRWVLSIWEESAYDSDPKSAPLFLRELGATSYRPGPNDAPLPDRIAWRVDAQPVEGAVRRGPVEKAWRRR